MRPVECFIYSFFATGLIIQDHFSRFCIQHMTKLNLKSHFCCENLDFVIIIVKVVMDLYALQTQHKSCLVLWASLH